MSRRYPLAALVEASGLTEHAMAQAAGLNGTPLKRARERGLVEAAAERYAIRLGFHPYNVWPEMADLAAADAEQAEQARLERRRQIARDSARRRYHEDADLRERRKASAAAWRAANQRTIKHHASRQPDTRRQQSRASYRRNAERITARLRERYANDPEWREAQLARQRARYAAKKAAATPGRALHSVPEMDPQSPPEHLTVAPVNERENAA